MRCPGRPTDVHPSSASSLPAGLDPTTLLSANDKRAEPNVPVFISYNHADRDFAENLAINLVHAKKNVWIDKWELSAGDSLISRIESALEGADAILIILSRNSIESEWCKKELRSGLIRELEEKSVLLIPIVIDDCEVPLFLREKLYVDFRESKDEAFALLLRSLERISNPAQARAEMPSYHIDWSLSIINHGDDFGVEWNFVDHGESLPYVVLTQVVFWPTGAMQQAFRDQTSDTDKFMFVSECMREILSGEEEMRFRITSAEPLRRTIVCKSSHSDGRMNVLISVRRMGQDTGMDTIVEVDRNLRQAISHTLAIGRHRGDKG